jgi:predicted AAA+ superfamily ATPase
MQINDKLYRSIGKFQSIVVPKGQAMEMAKKLPAMHFKIIETPVRQIHKRIAKHLEARLAQMDPVERAKKQKQLERNHQIAKQGTAANNLLTNAVNTIELQ